MASTTTADLLARYECGPVRFSGDENASYERRLVFDHVIDLDRANLRHKFEAVALAVRDLLTQRWLKTRQAHNKANAKRVYYLSMEFLVGRSLMNNIANLMIDPIIQEMVQHEKLDLPKLAEQDP